MSADLLEAHRQRAHRVRFDWGPTGAAAVADDAEVAVVVDVLSFTTTVSVAVDRGIAVLPFRWKDDRAEAYAAERDADLAADRVRGLSPLAMSRLPHVPRIVVPSPNGSVVSFGLASSGARVVAASLRNRTAVARHLASVTGVVAVIASGERWPDGSLRPCAEDLWGAGAVLDLLPRADLSPEACVAADAFRAADLPGGLHACAGGLELAAAGYAEDVRLAGDLDASGVVPVLEDGAFTAAPR